MKSVPTTQGDMEERLEYLCNTLGLTQDQRNNKHKVQEIDYVLDDIVRMDWVSAFPSLK